MNLIAKEWQQLVGGKMWKPTLLKVQSKMVLDQIVTRLNEAREFVQKWADDVDAAVSFDYERGMGKKSNAKKLARTSKADTTTLTKTRAMKVMKILKKPANQT